MAFSGTLLSPTVMVTAGHCTYGTSGGRVWFKADVQSQAAALSYPTGGAPTIAFCDIQTHPQFADGSFVLHDVGVVDAMLAEGRRYVWGLPAVVQLDRLKTKRGTQDVTFTAVGYGL